LPERSPEALQSFAEQIVWLVERVITPRDVFVIMSFGKDPELEDAYETFCAVCSRFNFNAFRVDHHVDEIKRIVHEVIDSIRRSAFIIADVSEPLEFDIYDILTVYWNNQRSLREGLTKRVERIASRAGR
jgi:hypothetical protein